MTERISIERDGAARARSALEHCVTGGGVAIFPADTLYGLACDPLNAAAIGRIQALKGRDAGKPSAVMYFSPLIMRELVGSLDEPTRQAVAALLPGPVTLVVANPAHRYPLACGGDPGKLGLRLIGGPLAGASVALFQTSANRSGDAPPARIEEVDDEIFHAVDLAIDGGQVGGAPSTVIDVSALGEGGGWRVLREGALESEQIASRIGRLWSA